MKKPFWTDDLAIEQANTNGIREETKQLAEALADEYQPHRVWGIIQAWLEDQLGG